MLGRTTRANRRTWGLVLLPIAVVLAGTIPASEVTADPGNWDYYSNCRDYTAYTDATNGLYAWETDTHVTPGWSSCSDINSIAHPCNYHRIRFYPSGGGSYTGDWVYDCDGARVIASSVLDGTTYRNETADLGIDLHIED